MNRSKIWIMLGVLVLVIGGATQFFIKRASAKFADNKETQVIVAQAKNASSSDSLMAQGTVVPAHTVNVTVNPGFQGQVLRVYADIGSRVTKGQVLAELDPTYVTNALAQSQLVLQTNKEHDSLTRTPYLPEQIEAKRLGLASDRLAVVTAQKKLTLLKEGARPEQIVEAQASVDSAKTNLATSQATYDRNVTLFSKELIPRVEMDSSTSDLSLAKNALVRAQAAYSLVENKARPEDIAIAENELQQSNIKYQQSLAEYSLMMKGSRPEDIAIAQLAVKGASLKTEETARNYSYHLVRAPISGVILARNVNPGEFAIPSVVRSSSTSPLQNLDKSLFVIADDSSVLFQASVDQRFYGNLKMGQTAQVGVEALPGRSFDGKIVGISRLINTDAGTRLSGNVINPTTPLTFAVMVKVPNPQGRLVPGQIGLITFQQRQAGLVIPQTAVTSFTLGEGVVYVEQNGIAKARSIKYDSNLDGQVRVLSGLRLGERVVISSPISLTDGAHVQPKLATADDLNAEAL